MLFYVSSFKYLFYYYVCCNREKKTSLHTSQIHLTTDILGCFAFISTYPWVNWIFLKLRLDVDSAIWGTIAKWQPTPVFLPGESQGRGSLVGCRLWGRRVGHDWSDLAAAATHLLGPMAGCARHHRYPHSTGEEPEDQKAQGSCLRSHNLSEVSLALSGWETGVSLL